MLFEFETNMITPSKEKLVSLDEGFTKGNMFANLYDPYKHYEPKCLKPKNEREALLLHIYKLGFALNDLNLYLDLHPNDIEVYEVFKKYALDYEKCVYEYEKEYQVLEVCHDTFGKYTWLDNPWPWEGYNV